MLAKITKLKSTEKWLFAIAGFLLIISVVATYKLKDILFTSKLDEKNSIARIENSTGNTRKRNPDSFKFEDARVGQYLGNGDYLFSGEGSQIMIKFKGGPRLLIGEQSLVVLREVDGTPDLKLEEGALSGTFEDGGELEILTEQESVIINGDAGAQFSVSYSSLGGLEVGSFKSPIKIQFEGKSATLKEEKALLKKNKNMQVAANTGSDDGKDSKYKELKDPAETPARAPSGVAFDTVASQDKVTLNPPYPKENHTFIHKGGGSIPVYPKLQCDGRCEVKIQIDGKMAATKLFERGTIPIVYVKVEPNIEGAVRWEFTDGTNTLTGGFFIRQNNEVNFKNALTQQFPIEVMD